MSNPAPLNNPQQVAVDAISGPLLVLAGAGTGKTRVVTYRIANLIRHRVKPEHILAVTFTKKAAKEMQQRVSKLLGSRAQTSPLVCTFHSLCVRILRRHIDTLGFPRKFLILDRGDQESHARAALREIRVADSTLSPGDVLWMIGRWKSHGLSPRQAALQSQSDKEQLGAVAFGRYVELLKQAGALDFDDLLLFTERLFREHPAKLATEARLWKHLLIDEYQDTNGEQYKIVKHLAHEHRNLCVVGDDDQSIYGWRGAQVQHILNFRNDWPDAKIVRLEDNYRSTREILEVANRLIAHNRQRHVKQLRAVRCGGSPPRITQMADEAKEASDVVRQIRAILQRPEVQPSDIAILFRTNEQPRPFETELRKANLPYVLVGGMSFFDRKEVKDLLAYFRLADNPLDEMAARRIINTPPRGIGKSTVTRVSESVLQQQTSFWDVLRQSELETTPAAKKGIQQFVSLIEKSREELAERPHLVQWATKFIAQLGYRAEIERTYSEPQDREARWASVEQVVSALGHYVSEHGDKANIADFLDEIAVGDQDFENEKEKQLGRNAIMLMTLHSAKGLEFPYVFMVGMEEGILPHHRSIESGSDSIDEERRLCYVGVTRAQEQLSFSMALARMKWGKPRDSRPSRFLYELTDQTSNPNYVGMQQSESTQPQLPASDDAKTPKQPPKPKSARGTRRTAKKG